MAATSAELNRFLDFFDNTCRDNALHLICSNKTVVIRVVMKRKENKDAGFDSSMIVTEARGISSYGGYDMSDSTITQLNFNPKFKYFKDGDVQFMATFIPRYFTNFKLIFSSPFTHIFIADVDDLTFDAYDATPVRSDHGIYVIPHMALFHHANLLTILNLSETDAYLSDYLWSVVLKSHETTKYLLSAYMSGEYKISDNINKRIHDLYESLTYSEKLLLELGYDI